MTQPTNHNLLSSLDFRMSLKRAPTVSYFAQQFTLPGITLPPAIRPTPFVNIPEIGDHLEFEPLVFAFKVDEDLTNYVEIFNWMRALGFPENWEQHQPLRPLKNVPIANTQTTDVSVITTTNARNPNKKITFYDAWPTNLSSLDFNTMDTEMQYLQATVTFNYTYYDISSI